MKKEKIKIAGISGSLRSASSASAVVRIAAGLVPANVDFEIYNGLEEIPAFNDSNEIPATVKDFIDLITQADAVFFCIPEYAFGVPGALKNAIDWTVSSVAFNNKPVALITAASTGEKAHAAFLLTLTAIATKKSAATSLLLPYIRNKMNANGEMTDLESLDAVKKVIHALIASVEEHEVD
jgi:NAD(P)H-dependent FMN reductase